jgi:hypothetical protein
MANGSCGPHRPYRRKADAMYAASWHLRCEKCTTEGPLGVWMCAYGHHHVGHRKREPATVCQAAERCRAQHDICAPPGAG